MIAITMNGEARQVAEGCTLRDLLASANYVADRVATMLNGHVVPRTERGAHVLHAADRVEVVSFAGGG